jgi:subtilisin family serine protease
MTDHEQSEARSSFPQEITGGEVVLTLLPGQVFVTFADALSSSEIEAFLEQYQLQPTERASGFISYKDKDIGDVPFYMGLFQWTTGEDTARLIAEIRADRRVRTASPVYHRADLLPAETMTSFSDQVLVHFEPHATEDQVSALITTLDIEIVVAEPFAREGTVYQLRLRFPKQQDIFTIVAEFARSPLVRYASPDWIQMQPPVSWTPNDPDFGQQWNLHKISAPSGWEHTKGSPRVVIAIIDSGCNLKHSDLVGKYVPVADRFDALTTYPKDRLLTDPPLNTNTPNDLFGHGTSCAGIAAAETNNNTGVSGVAPNCSIMPIRLFDGRDQNTLPFPSFIHSQADIVRAINWAQTHGANVISMSWNYTNPHNLADIALSDAFEANLVLVASAGNCFADRGCTNPTTVNEFPASHWAVMAVGASDENDQRKKAVLNPYPLPPHPNEWQSKYGSKLSVMAPGIDCFTTHFSGGYWDFSGTSAATPHVAGLAALIQSLALRFRTNLRNDDVRYIIEVTADKVGGYMYSNDPQHPNGTWNSEMGYGRINVANALIFARDNYTPYKFERVNRDYALSVLILFGLTPGGAGVVLPTSGPPVPVDPGWLHLTPEQRDVLLGLAITELAKGVSNPEMRQAIGRTGWDAIEQTAQRMK